MKKKSNSNLMGPLSSTLWMRQLFEHETSTYTYLLADPVTREALIIDSVLEKVERDLNLIDELSLQLKYILETHIHADHITGASSLKEKIQEKHNGHSPQIAVGKNTGAVGADLYLADGAELFLGQNKITALSTPGHTQGCTSYYTADKIFTGDTLLIRGCGRTDFQGGSSEHLFRSVREKIFTLPEGTFIYPGHDYSGQTCSSVAEEKRWNPRLKMEHLKDDFYQIMGQLKLSYPKKNGRVCAGQFAMWEKMTTKIPEMVRETAMADHIGLYERGVLGHLP